METSPARQAREVWLPNLPCVRPAGGPLSSPAHTPTLPHTHSPGLKPDVWMSPSTQGGALAGWRPGTEGCHAVPCGRALLGFGYGHLKSPSGARTGSLGGTVVLHIFQGVAEWLRAVTGRRGPPADLALSLRGRSGARPVAGLPGAARGGQSPSVPGSRSRGENTFTQLGRRGTTFGAQLGLEAVCLSR